MRNITATEPRTWCHRDYSYILSPATEVRTGGLVSTKGAKGMGWCDVCIGQLSQWVLSVLVSAAELARISVPSELSGATYLLSRSFSEI